jgi:ADP-heptose:LPS heptosyltransferase
MRKSHMTQQIKKMRRLAGVKAVLAYVPGALGDVLISRPALKAIRRLVGPEARLCVLRERKRGAVTPDDILKLEGLADGFLEYRYHDGAAAPLWSAARMYGPIVRQRFSAVFYVAGAKRSRAAVRRDEAFFRLCGIPVRLGFHATEEVGPADGGHEMNIRLARLERDGVDVAEERTDEAYHLALSDANRRSAKSWLAAAGWDGTRVLVAVCPATRMPAKQWPVENFEELGRMLNATGSVELVVLGAAEDQALAARLIPVWGAGINATGCLSVLESAAVLGEARLCLTLDTGCMHLAAAVGTKCVALFADKDFMGRWNPVGTQHIVIRRRVPCGGCQAVACPLHDHPCMRQITVAQVWSAVYEALEKGETPWSGPQNSDNHTDKTHFSLNGVWRRES